ncbi:MAG: hypothetical protein A3F10_05100 [Coxiella sp. RIFCSPHIGHO2_12_FULL_42_15]|nr:MAG: hypothetical protein A3F10_05100 [Coxiella sp. RIFCSPHIGHO2_12_FULL_42_15]
MPATENAATKNQTSLTSIRDLVKEDFDAVDALMFTEIASEIPLLNEITLHVVKSGGKRLRPLLLLLMNRLLGGSHEKRERHELAAIIEFIHTATLLHDDVIDESSKRRNQPTANALWGDAASVLAGDFLYSRAFQILARRNNIPVMTVLANTTNRISEGEIQQLVNIGNNNLSERDYRLMIQRKTAELYSAATKIGAMLATHNDRHYCDAAAQYGLHLGIAFQMIDDLLDYTADSGLTGKNLGDDLAEGKVTLPLIYTLHHGTKQQQHVVRQAIKTQGREAIEQVIDAIIASKGCEYTLNCAKQEAVKAEESLKPLPKNIYHDALLNVCEFVVTRQY